MNTKEIYKNIEDILMNSSKPSERLHELLFKKDIKSLYPFSLITNLEMIPQEPKHHPEGSVWNHVMLVVDEAAKQRKLSAHKNSLMWAALLHDLGKQTTTKKRKGRWTSYDHDKEGEILVREFFKAIEGIDADFSHRVAKLTRWHMQALFVIKKLPFADIETMVNDVDIPELALLTLSDRLGRGGISDSEAQGVYEDVNEFLLKVSRISGVKYKKLMWQDIE